MPFQYTFRADDISTWDVDTRDLVENRDRELELYASTIDSSFLNLNADNLTSGTVPSSRVTGSYTGITQVGTLTAGIASYSIGDTGPAGGKVFITPSTSGNTTGLYFEVAPVSAQVERTWSQFSPIFYQSTSVPLAQFDTIGTGKSNTVAIVNQGNNDPASCAAKYCDDYTYGGFSDWFLPSRNELAQIYTNRVAVGNDFGLGYFWSSSEEVYDGAWVRYFNGGADTYLAKANSLYVRPVRSFSTIGLNVRGSAVIRTAATQDGVILAGRAGGTSDYAVSILPTTLTASRTFTLPNVDGTAITTGNLSDITSVGTLASGSIPATLLTGTVASARLSGSYTGITGVGTLTSLTVNGSNAFSPAITFGDWNQNGDFTAIRSAYGYLLFGSANGPNTNLYLRTETASGTVIIGGGGSGSTANNTMTVGASSVSVTGSISATTTITATGEMTASKLNVGGSYFNTTPQVSGSGIAFTGATVGGGTANLMGMRWANPNITGTVDNAVTAVLGTVSDRRFKTNIITLSNVLPTVRQLRPVTYNPLDVIGFNEDNTVIIGDKDPYDKVEGFVADEVEQVAPWLVQGGENGGYQSVNYALFAPMLVAAIQEIDARLQQLETT